jgi:hypothetical protein
MWQQLHRLFTAAPAINGLLYKFSQYYYNSNIVSLISYYFLYCGSTEKNASYRRTPDG